MERLLKSVYSVSQDTRFLISSDSVFSQKPAVVEQPAETSVAGGETGATEDIESDSLGPSPGDVRVGNLNKSLSGGSGAVLCQTRDKERAVYVDLMLEKCWSNLMHYVRKQRCKLEAVGNLRRHGQMLKELDCLVVLVERRMQRFPASFDRNVSLQIKKKCRNFFTNLNLRCVKYPYENFEAHTSLWNYNGLNPHANNLTVVYYFLISCDHF